MDYPPPMGGIQVVTKNLEEDLTTAGYEVCLLNFDGRNTNNFKKLKPSDFFYTQATRNEFYSPLNIINPIRILQPSGYRDFVYNNMIYHEANKARKYFHPDITHILKPTLYSAIHECQEPVIVSCHGEELQNIFPVIYSLKKASLIHCVSVYTRNLVVGFLGDHKEIVIIPNSIELANYKKRAIDKEAIILSCCRLVERKNISSLINAISILPDDLKKKYKFIIIGDGPDKDSLIKMSRDLGMKNIEFLGQISEREKLRYFNKSKIFVLCPKPYESYFEGNEEGFGISYIEAQAAGMPVIGSNIGGIPEAIGDGGILIQNPTNIEEIAVSIKKFLTDDSFYKHYQSNALLRIKQFDRKLIFKHFEQLYQRVLSNQSN